MGQKLSLFLVIFSLILSVKCVKCHDSNVLKVIPTESMQRSENQNINNVRASRYIMQADEAVEEEPPGEINLESGGSNSAIPTGVGVLETFQQQLNNILNITTPTSMVDSFAQQSLLQQLGIAEIAPVDPIETMTGSEPIETMTGSEPGMNERSARTKFVVDGSYHQATSTLPKDSLIQIVGSQISNSGQQFQNATSQIAGVFSNTTSALTETSNGPFDTGFQSQLQQLINTIGPALNNNTITNLSDSSQPTVSQDSIFQQLGSQITNQFGTNAANGTQLINSLQPVTTQFQSIGNQLTGTLQNSTNVVAGTNSADIQNQLQQLLNTLGPNPTKPPNQQSDNLPPGVAQDSLFQQLGSQFTNLFIGNSTNNSSATNPLGEFAGQFQNIGSQITGGIANASSALIGSSNSANSSTGSNPLDAISSQFQNVGMQITGGITNVGNVITGSSNSGNDTSFLSSLQNQLLSLLNGTSSGSNPSQINSTNNEVPTNGNNSTASNSTSNGSSSNNSSSSQANDPIFPENLQFPLSQIQNVGSQITSGFSNTTMNLIPNTPVGIPDANSELQNLVNQLTPSSVSQTSNQVTEALKPSSVQGQLQGIGSQFESNIPVVANDLGIIDSIAHSILNWNSLNGILLPSLTSSNNYNLKPEPAPSLCPVCTPVCGKINPRSRVAGGTDFTPTNKYPWTARIMYFGTDVGQGTLINDRAVVTTATIIKSIPIYSAVTILFNVYSKTSTTEQRLEKRVANIYTPSFFEVDNIYDKNIGIIRLATPVTFSSTFMPICLPKYYDSIGGTSGTLVGWGASTLTGSTSDTPREVSIPLYTDRECQLSNSNLTINNLCGGVIKPAPSAAIKATCKGDDGAALMYPSRTDPTVLTFLGVAIDVPNQGCGETNQLSVFSKVYNYLVFIIQYGSGCGC